MTTFAPSSTRTHGHRLNPAIAKAKLISLSLFAASRQQLPPTTIALLAVLIAESWPSGDGWSVSIARSTLANRLSVTIRTIDKARNQLLAAGLINHTPGDPRRASSFTILDPSGSATSDTPEVQQTAPQGRSDNIPCRATGDTSGVQPMTPSSVWQNSASAGGEKNHAAAAADSSLVDSRPEPVPPEILARRTAAILVRPDWLPQGKPWIGEAAAAQLASLRHIGNADWLRIVREAKDSRNTLSNPAAWIIKETQRVDEQRRSTPAVPPHPNQHSR